MDTLFGVSAEVVVKVDLTIACKICALMERKIRFGSLMVLTLGSHVVRKLARVCLVHQLAVVVEICCTVSCSLSC